MGTDQKTITVADLSDGPPLGSQPDAPVDLPVVEILTGRGFVTGKSGSGKSNTASVVAEKLLDAGFGLLIVDIDGEYYGLKEEYEILHVGGDDECDIQVTADHAGKLASLALEQNVPIILDVSSFLDESEAAALLKATAKQLFAKEKKLKQPFLLLVEECHEWIPEKGSVDEVGRMLIKIGKRGRKHGLGIVGISQRPADVKKDFITQCDWLVWHRLTWNNDTKVVSRILDGTYADAVEDLDDGEAFMMTDWSESVRRVQFQRKQTFDAGATPGLEDVDRPDLKSVSSDLVSELAEISDERERTEDHIAELREQLDEKNSRIAELEAELKDARDMSRMADQFVEALVQSVDGTNPGKTEQERMRERRRAQTGRTAADADDAAGETDDAGDTRQSTNGTATTGDETMAALAAVGGPDGSDGGTGATGNDTPSTVSDEGQPSAAGGTETGDGVGAEAPLTPDGAAVRDRLCSTVDSMQKKTRTMLRYYAGEGPAKPTDAHFASGGHGDRTTAYAHNRTLRTHGFIEHVGRGHYDTRLADLIAEELGDDPDEAVVDDIVEALEGVFLLE